VPTLTIRAGAGVGRELVFDRTIVVGRGGMVDLEVTDSSVSRRHAQVFNEADGWFVRDLGSANGTFVNGRRVAGDIALSHGDVVRLGSIALDYTQSAHAASTSDTTSIRYVDRDQAHSQVVLRVNAEEAEREAQRADRAGGQWSLLVESFARIGAIVFEERAVLALAIEQLVKMLPHAERGFVMLWDSHLDRFVPGAARTRGGATDTIVASHTLLREVLTRKEAVLIANIGADAKFASSESILSLKMRTAVCAPVLFQGQIFGVIQADSTSNAEPFIRADVEVVLAVASQLAMALAYARLHAKLTERELFERDLGLARKIQHHFLPPELPAAPGFEFAVDYRPALAVGGDLYDFIPLADGRLAVTVGDVSGKGIAAALFAAKVMSDIRYQAVGQADASTILARINRTLAERDHDGMFVTLALTIIDPRRSRLTVASAGHPLPVVRDAAGHVMTIGHGGDAPLGVDAAARFEQYVYEFDCGDTVVLFTDGVIEALNGQHELYGTDRLISTVAGCESGAASALVRTIGDSVTAFAGIQEQSDDVTVVCFQRRSD
jgi:serine phosphatase RsbU (regulator of sigma subunit)